jgi:hypothetical protein
MQTGVEGWMIACCIPECVDSRQLYRCRV